MPLFLHKGGYQLHLFSWSFLQSLRRYSLKSKTLKSHITAGRNKQKWPDSNGSDFCPPENLYKTDVTRGEREREREVWGLDKAVKADLARIPEEEIGIGARLLSVESSLIELKSVICDLKAKVDLVDDLVNLVTKAVIDKDLNHIDQPTMVLMDEATKAFTEAPNEAQSRGSRRAAARNVGGHQGSSRDIAREEIGIEARLLSVESSLEELKRMIWDLKAKAKLVDDLVNLVIKAVIDNDFNIEQATVVMIDEATRAFTEALNESCPVVGGSGGGHEDSYSKHN
ncbi:hypothetical protein ERO13_D11G249133v2 [Gossypium hirsutum]|uniref:Uncharacterized protein n=1 Tax=Gossypium hirsutum TaxID=3635 RepID=A0A1U8PQU4_GOSHI|nr:uncharacterized protein LOC107961882 [Gossypium hirsutum]KAG4122159.1 hypothetical protein ERO13_D11G249133v2 [Gossypium hirsutum]